MMSLRLTAPAAAAGCGASSNAFVGKTVQAAAYSTRVALPASRRSLAVSASAAVAAEASPAAAPASFNAVIDVGGHQQIVSVGRYYSCNNLKVDPGTKLAFQRVLAVKDGEKFIPGKPYVVGASVEATVMEHYKDKKVLVYHMRPKKHTRKKSGHRQHLTRFLVTKVNLGA